MKALVVDSGGRGNINLFKFWRSSRIKKLYVAPGNAGSVQFAERVPIKATDVQGLLEFAKAERIDLTYIGQEAPISLGIGDMFREEKLNIIAPSRAAARTEYSKCWFQDVLSTLGLPVIPYQNFCNHALAMEYVRKVGYPVVVKADGLAAGKGSLVCDDVASGEAAIKTIMVEKKFGDAGDWVNIQKRIYGRELSLFAVTDGYTVKPYEGAQDFKRGKDGDKGKNSGGMGSYSPHPLLTEELKRVVLDTYLIPLVTGLREKYGILYQGIIYIQLIIDEDGDVWITECNIRGGDPEDQVIQIRLKTDIVDICEAILTRRLHEINFEWDPSYWLCLVTVSGEAPKDKKGNWPGYPGRYKTGQVITGLENVNSRYPGIVIPGSEAKNPDCLIIHAGTEFIDKEKQEGLKVVGGRVLSVVHKGVTLQDAGEKAYAEMEKIKFDWKYNRSDIGMG